MQLGDDIGSMARGVRNLISTQAARVSARLRRRRRERGLRGRRAGARAPARRRRGAGLRAPRAARARRAPRAPRRRAAPRGRPLVRAWRRRAQLYACAAGGNDDWYWLAAAVAAGDAGWLVSNDEMRDHHFGMLSRGDFLQWKARTVVKFEMDGGDVALAPPPPYSESAQFDAGGWHVPARVGAGAGEASAATVVVRRPAPGALAWLCCAPARVGRQQRSTTACRASTSRQGAWEGGSSPRAVRSGALVTLVRRLSPSRNACGRWPPPGACCASQRHGLRGRGRGSGVRWLCARTTCG